MQSLIYNKREIYKYAVIYQIPEDIDELLLDRFLYSVLHYTNDVDDAKTFIYDYTEKNSHIKLCIFDLEEYTFVEHKINKLKISGKYSDNRKRYTNKTSSKIKFTKK